MSLLHLFLIEVHTILYWALTPVGNTGMLGEIDHFALILGPFSTRSNFWASDPPPTPPNTVTCPC